MMNMATTRYQVTIGDATLLVVLRREGSQVLARVGDGPERPVHLSTVQGALRSLELGAQRVELLAERTPEAIHLAIEGVQYRAEVVDEARARLARLVGAGGTLHARRELKAPMPGLVVKVLCQPGDAVGKGQPLLVLHAMKMENELSLPQEGTVKSVGVRAGQTVEQGQVLVVVE
jgi:biotin carboxyl carrier protein